jgi:hypothetical protein
VASVLTDIGSVYSSQQKFSEAERHFLKAIGIVEKSREEQAQMFLRNALAAYARMLRQAKRDADAQKIEARLKGLEQ